MLDKDSYNSYASSSVTSTRNTAITGNGQQTRIA